MIHVTQELTLNVRDYGRGGYTKEKIVCKGKQGDYNVRTLKITVCGADGEPVSFDGSEHAFFHASRTNAETREREKETFNAAIEDGKVVLHLPAWVFAFAGKVYGEIEITTAQATIRTESFVLESYEAIRSSMDEAADDEDVQTLAALIARIDDLAAEIENIGPAILPETDETLRYDAQNRLCVNTTNDAQQDNTLPITSAGVFTQLGNIEALLETL